MRSSYWLVLGEAFGLFTCVAFFYAARPLDYCYYDGTFLVLAKMYQYFLLPVILLIQTVAVADKSRVTRVQDFRVSLLLAVLVAVAIVGVQTASRDHTFDGTGDGYYKSPYPACPSWRRY